MRAPVRLSLVLSCVALAACSGTSNTSSTDDAGADTGPDIEIVDSPAAGFGDVVVTWTVNGMPPAAGCAAAGAANVRLQVFFGRPETLPCTQGTFTATRVSATTLNVGADLLRADGSTIYAYNVETTVVANQSNNVVVPFEPQGSLRVRWTINGQPAATECANVGGVDVRLSGRRITNPPVRSCRTGQTTVTGLQPGEYSIEAMLTKMQSATTVTGLNTQRGTATVLSGQVVDLDVDFAAPVLRDQ